MKLYLNYWLLLSVLVLWLVSCEHPFTDIAQPVSDTVLVVDGLITNEKKQHYVRLSTMAYAINQVNKPVSGALVTVTTGDSIYRFTESDTEKGLYLSEKAFIGITNDIYVLLTEYKGIKYNATARMEPVTVLDTVQTMFHQSANMFSVSAIGPTLVARNPAMHQVNLQWQNPVYPFELKEAVLYFYALTTIDVSQLFSPEQEKVFFPAGTRLIVRKMSLSEAHESFIRSVLAETTWRGGFFDENPGNSQTNISNGALGFFAACSVITDTLIVH